MKIMDVTGIATQQGIIWNLAFDGYNHIAVIESKPHTVRSNHYHKTTSHWLYVVSGEMNYFEKDLDGTNLETACLRPGQMVLTGPNKLHRCEFPKYTVLVSLTDNASQSAHEEDRVKVEW